MSIRLDENILILNESYTVSEHLRGIVLINLQKHISLDTNWFEVLFCSVIHN